MAKLPKAIIRKYGISKKAWKVFRSQRGTTSRKSVKTLARRRSYRPRRAWFRRRRIHRAKIPLAATMGLVSSMAIGSSWSGGNSVLSRIAEGNFNDAAKIACMHYLGVDPYTGKWDIKNAVGLVPIFVGCGISMAASKLGFNKYLRKVPYIQI